MAAKTKGRSSIGSHVASVSHGRGGGHASTVSTGKTYKVQPQRQRVWDTDPTLNPGKPMNHPLYASMEFPDYQYEEYPKHINHADGSFTVVNNEAEEELALADKPIVREEDERKRLIALADVHKITVDRRWNTTKLAQAIQVGGFDPSTNPFE